MSTGTNTDVAANTPKLLICPYCGDAQPAAEHCRSCKGAFEPLSRQATHNAMGPWFVHDHTHPFRPGCSYETLATMIGRGQVTRYTIIRGPTTKQFWTVARHVPGVAHLLGYCHECDAKVDPTATGCSECGALFGAYLDRNHLGLPEVRPLPGEAPDLETGLAASRSSTGMAPPVWRSVSSFAADEELLAPAAAAASIARPDTTRAEHVPAGHAAQSSSSASGDPLHSPMVRAMQRRIARQQRTIRMLVGLVFVVAVIGAAFNLMSALRGNAVAPSSGNVPESADVPDALDAGGDDDAGTVADAASDENDKATADDAGASSTKTAPVRSADDEVVTRPATAAADDEATDAAARRRRAEELVTAAADVSRPVADRIADSEAALVILRGLAGATDDPAAFEAQIARLEERIERLRLGEFFR